MDNTVSFIKTKDGISLILNGKPYQVNSDHLNYEKISNALKTKSYAYIPELVNVAKAIGKYVKMVDRDGLSIDEDNGIITYKGFNIHHTLVDRIFQMIKEGFDAKPLVNFLFNLFQNPSEKAIDELYTFLEYGKMPITEDGHFVAYKRVNAEYKSIYDGKTDNSIGSVVSMPRDQVNHTSSETCSRGLHICSFDYLSSYSGERVIIVKVNPKNVVSIPTDYSNTKARVCEYKVIGELSLSEAGLPDNTLSSSSVYMEAEEDQEWDDEETEDEDDLEMDMTDAEYEANEIVKRETAKHQTTQADAVINELTQKIADSKTVVPVDVQSDWYKFGYSCGYIDGKKKEPIAEDATMDDLIAMLDSVNRSEKELRQPLIPQNIHSINAGYLVGHKDGRAHAKRKFPDIKTIPFDFK